MENNIQTPPIQTPNQPPKPSLILPVLLILLFLLLCSAAFLAYQNMQLQKQIVLLKVTNQNTIAPTITGWQKYSDQARGNFSFDYPGFLPAFIETTSKSTYSTSESPGLKTMINGNIGYHSWFIWNTEKLSSGNYEHKLEISVIGPIANTSKMTLKNWIKEQNWPSEGEVQEMAGITKVNETVIDQRTAIISLFTESGSQTPRGWRIYFNTKDGIYYINLSFQGTNEELGFYKNVFDHTLSTFKFLGQTTTPSTTPSADKYTCPANGWVDCMPILTSEKQAACSPEAMSWYKANCPDFKGGAL